MSLLCIITNLELLNPCSPWRSLRVARTNPRVPFVVLRTCAAYHSPKHRRQTRAVQWPACDQHSHVDFSLTRTTICHQTKPATIPRSNDIGDDDPLRTRSILLTSVSVSDSTRYIGFDDVLLSPTIPSCIIAPVRDQTASGRVRVSKQSHVSHLLFILFTTFSD